jgi:hypothetical protein
VFVYRNCRWSTRADISAAKGIYCPFWGSRDSAVLRFPLASRPNDLDDLLDSMAASASCFEFLHPDVQATKVEEKLIGHLD